MHNPDVISEPPAARADVPGSTPAAAPTASGETRAETPETPETPDEPPAAPADAPEPPDAPADMPETPDAPTETPDDAFTLYDLVVEVLPPADGRPMVCSHRLGEAFRVEGENLVFPRGGSFSLYALAALLPLLPAKQRPLQPNDWMLSDAEIACPDPNCGARFRISRVAPRVQSHAACTVVPLGGQAPAPANGSAPAGGQVSAPAPGGDAPAGAGAGPDAPATSPASA